VPEWIDTETGAAPTDQQVQQVISAERGHPKSGQRRRWFRPDADVAVLTVDETGLKLSRDDGTTAPAPPIVVGSPAGGSLTGTYPDPTVSAATVDALLPPGTIWAYGGESVPAGWLPCNGGWVSRADYPKLFAIIGTTYGNAGGDPALFSLPNLTGRFPLGEGAGHLRGQLGGSETAPGPLHSHPGAHQHPMAHTHPGSHNHTNAHTHDVVLAHDHLAPPLTHPNGTSPVVGTGTTTVNGTAVSPVTVADGIHYHNFDVPAILPTAAPVTSVPAPALNTGINTTYAPAVDAATPDTSPVNSHPDADYLGVTIPTMPPFGVVQFMIRAGA
jgi:microcystin-dependent protein